MHPCEVKVEACKDVPTTLAIDPTLDLVVVIGLGEVLAIVDEATPTLELASSLKQTLTLSVEILIAMISQQAQGAQSYQ